MQRAAWRATGSGLRGQRGQALVFITITSVIVLLVALATFNVGSITYHRIKLQNTADAAAYSAAVAHARELNFAAYMNRGVIANQVAVAQIVSLTGWARNFNDTYNGEFATISETLSSLSTLAAMWQVPFDALKVVAEGAKGVLDSVAPIATNILDVLIDGELLAAKAYHLAMTVSIPAEVIKGVVDDNEDKKASISFLGGLMLAKSAIDQYGFTTTYSPKQDKDGDTRMGKVTQASMDVFYKDRSLPPIWPIPILIDPTRLFTYGVGPLLMMQFHSGGSALKSATSDQSKNLQAYSSLDATGLFVIMCVTIPVFGIPVPIPFPLPPLPAGRGAAFAGNSGWNNSDGLLPTNNLEHRNLENTGVDSLAAVQYGAAHFNPMTAIPAWIQVAEGPGSGLDSKAGIRDYMDIKGNASNNTSNAVNTSTGANKNDVAPAWILEIERSDTSLLTSTSPTYNIGGGGGDSGLNLPMATSNGKIRALARSEAFFSRPKFGDFARSDGKTEWGSLYSPYWQARLTPNTLLEQGASALSAMVW